MSTAIKRPTIDSPGPVATLGAWVGAGLLAWSAIIHLHLWSTGYWHIPTIGWLFLVQGVAGLVQAAAIAVSRRALPMLAGAVFAVGTIGGLLLSVHVGLFGFHDSLDAPFATESLAIEAAAALVLTGFAAAAHSASARRRPMAGTTRRSAKR